MKLLFISLFALFGFIIGAAYAAEPGHVHKPHPHKHEQYAKKNNPVSMTEQSIEAGRKLFEKYCSNCHGEGSKDDSRLNLTDSSWIHGDSDGEMFHVITDGAAGTRMRAFKKILKVEMRWHLVNYIKSKSAAGEATARPGRQIRRTSLNGYSLTYYLLNLTERDEMMKKMGSHSVLGLKKAADVTNHLMVYIQKSDGKIMPGEVAYLLTGPDGRDFRTMTMGMYGGYGADISLNLKGLYTIRANILMESGAKSNFNDEFTFPVK